MARAMARFSVCLLLLLIVFLAGAEGAAKKPKKVKCKDKKYPNCYHKNRYCPASCLRTCVVDCKTCQPVCTPPPPPPPSPPPPPPKPKKHSPPPPPKPRKHSPPPPYSSPPPSPSQFPPPPPPPTTPPSSDSVPKKVKCKNQKYPHCYGMELPCPSDCADHCGVDCVTCKPICNCNRPGAVCQDPRFIGGDGITFYFHGKKDRDFCLVSDSNLHINAHFIGRRNENMKRDFTWVQSLGILFGNHQLLIGAMKTATWDDALDHLYMAFDGQTTFLPEGEGSKWQPLETPEITITRTRDANAVEIEVENNFKIKATVVPITEKDSRIHNYGITREDCFAHLDLSFKFYALSDNINGVLGQTYASNYLSRVKMGVAMPVLGGEREFSSSSLFATDCSVARFSGRSNSSENLEYAGLDCASGLDGRVVVCKR